MFDLAKGILKQLLTLRNTAPERLSAQEMELVQRIVHCTLCGNFWVRRKQKLPERCPACHKRGWDRPLITAMVMSQQQIPKEA